MRFEVQMVVTQSYHYTVEAENVGEAAAKALQMSTSADAEPEVFEVHYEVSKGFER